MVRGPTSAPDHAAAAARRGGLNVFTRWLVDSPAVAAWPSCSQGNGSAESPQHIFAPGNADFELPDDIDVAPEDRVIEKTRFSALIPGTSDLASILDERPADEIHNRAINAMAVTFADVVSTEEVLKTIASNAGDVPGR